MNSYQPQTIYSNLFNEIVGKGWRIEADWMDRTMEQYVPSAITRNIRAKKNLRFCALWLERNGFRVEWNPNRKEIWRRNRRLATFQIGFNKTK